MIIWEVATEGWLRLATEQARLSPACRWERMGLNRCMSPAPGFPVPPPQAHAPGGGQGLHYHTPRAPPTTTDVAATTDYCCCCCGYCCCYYYDYYILCLFLLPLPLLLPLLNPTMYVHMYAPTTGHKEDTLEGGGGGDQ